MLSNAGLYLKVGVVALAFAAGWTGNGWRLGEALAEREAQAAEASKRQIADTLVIERLNAERAAAVSAKAAIEAQKQVVKTRIVTKKVIEYVQSPTTGKCELPDAWVWVHNRAAGSDMPLSTSAASAPSTTSARAATDRDALIVVTENYNRCQANIGQLKGLIEWARSLTLQSSNL